MKLLVFDIWGPYAHFKKYYATTSALTYGIPPKTSLYGFVGAVLGLPKAENAYLRHFSEKKCLIGLQLLAPLKTGRIGVNLRPHRGMFKDNPKPTLIELVKEPRYRVFFHHSDEALQTRLKTALQEHACAFTPSLGLANLLADFAWVGECGAEFSTSGEATSIGSAIPRKQFLAFGDPARMAQSDVIEQTMFAIEMDTERNVTERDDILLERSGLDSDGNAKPIHAVVTHFYKTADHGNLCLF